MKNWFRVFDTKDLQMICKKGQEKGKFYIIYFAQNSSSKPVLMSLPFDTKAQRDAAFENLDEISVSSFNTYLKSNYTGLTSKYWKAYHHSDYDVLVFYTIDGVSIETRSKEGLSLFGLDKSSPLFLFKNISEDYALGWAGYLLQQREKYIIQQN